MNLKWVIERELGGFDEEEPGMGGERIGFESERKAKG